MTQDTTYLATEDHYSTYDLGQSAALVSLGFQIVAFDKSNPRKIQFVFQRSAELDKAVEAYWDDQLQVRARSMFDSVKMLKNRIYSA
ncbi:hypothetical protein HYV73_00925 [Candidatus Uhrbacteria bacterium]|nr:hypothetical protein [Candidatus Uhrbacteria bacterium]